MKSTSQADTSRLTLVSKAQESQHQAIGGLDPIGFLQTIGASLDLGRVLTILNSFLEDLVGHRGWEYRSAGSDAAFEGGKRDRHRLEYALNLSGEQIGTFTIMRGRRFSETDQVRIEALLGLAAPALKNAQSYQAILQLLERDTLTGLGNRRALFGQGAQWLADAIRQDRPLSMLAVDLDDFKIVNDSFGHPAGDRVLVGIAEILRASTRASDLCVRMGGDEFAVLLPGADYANAMRCAERIRLAVEASSIVTSNGDSIRVSASIGVATYRSGMDLDQLYHQADDALYVVKRSRCARVLATVTAGIGTSGARAAN